MFIASPARHIMFIQDLIAQPMFTARDPATLPCLYSVACIYILWHPRPCCLFVFLSSTICYSVHFCSWVQSLKWNVVISKRLKKHKWNKTPISLRTSADVLDMNWSFHPPWYAASGPFVLCGMQRSKQGHLMSSFPAIFWSCLFLVYIS